jgi:hypothetical protein
MLQTGAVEGIKETRFGAPPPFFKHGVCEKMWKYIVWAGRAEVTEWRMRNACWIPKATEAHSEYVILTAFPLQQRLHELASLLWCTYIAGVVTCDLDKRQPPPGTLRSQ